jgi:hypothetical protein
VRRIGDEGFAELELRMQPSDQIIHGEAKRHHLVGNLAQRQRFAFRLLPGPQLLGNGAQRLKDATHDPADENP